MILVDYLTIRRVSSGAWWLAIYLLITIQCHDHNFKTAQVQNFPLGCSPHPNIYILMPCNDAGNKFETKTL